MLTQPYDTRMIRSFDRLGRVHAAAKVELIHMIALQGFVQDAAIGAFFAHKTSGVEGKNSKTQKLL